MLYLEREDWKIREWYLGCTKKKKKKNLLNAYYVREEIWVVSVTLRGGSGFHSGSFEENFSSPKGELLNSQKSELFQDKNNLL